MKRQEREGKRGNWGGGRSRGREKGEIRKRERGRGNQEKGVFMHTSGNSEQSEHKTDLQESVLHNKGNLQLITNFVSWTV